MKRRILAIALIIIGTVTVNAATPQYAGVLDTLEMEISYRANSTALDLNYKNNRSKINAYVEQIRNKTKYQGYEIKELNIFGSSSIDGRSNFNIALREQRVDNLAEYFRNSLSLPEDKIHGYFEEEHWNAMIQEVEASDMPYREEVLDILINTPEWIRDANGVIVDGRKLQLQTIHDEAAWWYMSKHIFPALRKARVQVVLVKVKEVMVQAEPMEKEVASKVITVNKPIVDTVLVQVVDTIQVYDTVRVVKTIEILDTVKIYNEKAKTVKKGKNRKKDIVYPSPDRFPVLAFRTNLLAPLLNIGMEIPLGNLWSMDVEGYYPLLGHTPDYSIGLDFFYVGGALRYWIGEKHNSFPESRMYRLVGHSIGIYGGGGMYDMVMDGNGLIGGFATGGFEYLCSIPVANGKLSIELSIGAGFIFSEVHEYNVRYMDGSYIPIETNVEQFTFFGPTRASIALVVPIYKRK